jgi:hypothetical protein
VNTHVSLLSGECRCQWAGDWAAECGYLDVGVKHATSQGDRSRSPAWARLVFPAIWAGAEPRATEPETNGWHEPSNPRLVVRRSAVSPGASWPCNTSTIPAGLPATALVQPSIAGSLAPPGCPARARIFHFSDITHETRDQRSRMTTNELPIGKSNCQISTKPTIYDRQDALI